MIKRSRRSLRRSRALRRSITTAAANFDRANVNSSACKSLTAATVCVTGDQLAAVLASANQSGSAPASPSLVTVGRNRHPARDPDQRRQSRHHPSRRELHRPRSHHHRPPGRPQPRHSRPTSTATLESPIELDTSAAATDTIAYVVTDSQGLTSTSTRTVIVEPAAAPPAVPASVDASSSATTTVQ